MLAFNFPTKKQAAPGGSSEKVLKFLKKFVVSSKNRLKQTSIPSFTKLQNIYDSSLTFGGSDYWIDQGGGGPTYCYYYEKRKGRYGKLIKTTEKTLYEVGSNKKVLDRNGNKIDVKVTFVPVQGEPEPNVGHMDLRFKRNNGPSQNFYVTQGIELGKDNIYSKLMKPKRQPVSTSKSYFKTYHPWIMVAMCKGKKEKTDYTRALGINYEKISPPSLMRVFEFAIDREKSNIKNYLIGPAAKYSTDDDTVYVITAESRQLRKDFKYYSLDTVAGSAALTPSVIASDTFKKALYEKIDD